VRRLLLRYNVRVRDVLAPSEAEPNSEIDKNPILFDKYLKIEDSVTLLQGSATTDPVNLIFVLY